MGQVRFRVLDRGLHVGLIGDIAGDRMAADGMGDASPAAALRSKTPTFAPAADNRRQIASPMPCPPPVTNAILPSRRKNSVMMMPCCLPVVPGSIPPYNSIYRTMKGGEMPMLTAGDIQEKLRRRPFVPFRVVMSSGQFYDIHHPDLVLIGKRHLFVGTASEDNPTMFDKSSLLSILHVAAIEMLPNKARRRAAMGRNNTKGADWRKVRARCLTSLSGSRILEISPIYPKLLDSGGRVPILMSLLPQSGKTVVRLVAALCHLRWSPPPLRRSSTQPSDFSFRVAMR